LKKPRQRIVSQKRAAEGASGTGLAARVDHEICVLLGAHRRPQALLDESPSAFTAMFRRVMGKTPKHYLGRCDIE
jgi:hypothetical protein